jgi:hypothetical protein
MVVFPEDVRVLNRNSGVIHRFFLELFMVIFDFLDYFRDLIVDISFLTHLRANFLSRVHDRCVVPVSKVSADLRKRQIR